MKTVGVKIKNEELPLLNRQLDRLSYVTLGDMVKDLIAGRITRLTDDQQIDIMKTNLETNGQLTGLLGKPYDFYKQIDIDDLHKYLIEKYHHHTGNCYLSYFEKYASTFFGPNPDVELFKLKPHKRSWILQSIKRFGDYYFRKYNNREVTQLIKGIIERYDLNKDLDMKDHIYLVSPQFIEEKVRKIITLPGEIGFTARLGLFSGLREQELIYIKEKAVCDDGYGCDCDKLHVVDCKNGMTVIAIGWTRGNKKALATILPINYWNKLRTLPKFDYSDIAATHKIMKRDVGIAYIAMRKIHYNVIYGDLYPVTPGGKIVASMLMVIGIAILGILISTLGAGLIESRFRREDKKKAIVPSLTDETKILIKDKIDKIGDLNQEDFDNLLLTMKNRRNMLHKEGL